MQINATFLIQIINFWVTYTVLHRLFLGPTVKLIEKKDAAKAVVLERLKAMNATLLDLQEDKKKQHADFKEYIKTRYASPTITLQEIPVEVSVSKSQDEIDDVVAATKTLLTSKVPRAY